MTHSIDSPSALSRRRRCPGSRRLEQAAGVERHSEAARSGTHTHWLVQYCLEESLEPVSLVGQSMEDEEGLFTVDAERADRATVMTDYVRSRMAEVGGVIHCEVRVDPGRRVGRKGMDGTSDVVLTWDEGVEVIDYKDGFEPVEVVDNDQLLAYLSGAIATLPTVATQDMAGHELRMTIVQPRKADTGGRPVDTTTVLIQDLASWEACVSLDLTSADAEDAPLVPGEVQCRWCSAAGACKARAEQALGGVTFPMVAADGGLDEQTDALVRLAEFSPELLNDDQIVRFLEGIPIAREVFKRVEEYATGLIKQGRTLDNYYLKKTYGNRSWVRDAKATESALRRKAGLKKADMIEQKLRSPTQILRNKSLTREQREWVEDHLIERKETGAKLAHVTEQGESAHPKAPDGMFQPAMPAFLQRPTGD